MIIHFTKGEYELIDYILCSINSLHYKSGDLKRFINSDKNPVKNNNGFFVFLIDQKNKLVDNVYDAWDYYWEYGTDKTSYKGIPIIEVIDIYLKLNNRMKPQHLKFDEVKTLKDAENKIHVKFNYNPVLFIQSLIKHTSSNVDNLSVKDRYYLPIIRIEKRQDFDDRGIVHLIINNEKYVIYLPTEEHIVSIDGLFNISNESIDGECSAHAGLFACESLEQAMFLAKYYSYEMFVAMYGNSPFIKSIKLVKRKY